VSTVALAPAAKALIADGVLLHYTDIHAVGATPEGVQEQEGGTHADEIETSIMLYIAPKSAGMRQGRADYHPGTGASHARRSRGCLLSGSAATPRSPTEGRDKQYRGDGNRDPGRY
jgi:creatinine amidohydrolase